MAMKWLETLGKGLGFCWRPKRWLPFFITDLACILLVLAYVYSGLGTLLSIMASLASGSPAYLPGFAAFLAPLIIIGIVCGLINLWIKGAVIHQAWKDKEFGKSWRISLRRYPSLFAVVIITGILAYLAGLSYVSGAIPPAGYLGSLLSFLVSIALYFSLQIVIIKGRGFWDSLMGSWQLFRDQVRKKMINKRNIFILILVSEVLSSPALLMGHIMFHVAILYWVFCWFIVFAFLSLIVFSRVCDAMILVGIVSLIIILIFSIPLLLIILNILVIMQAAALMGSGPSVLLGMLSIIKEALLPLATSGIILLIGVSVSRVFSIKAQTEFYLKFRKKALGLI